MSSPPAVERTPIVPSAELANYVVAHSEFSAPVNRRNLLSALVASETLGTDGARTTSPTMIANVVRELRRGRMLTQNAR